MTAKVVNITLLSLSMLATLTASSQSVEIKRPIDNGIADVEYYYNMHGWLTGIKGGRFEQQILYETGSGTPQYSGNISSVVWRNGKNGNRSYCFTYDTLNRLEKGEYTDVNSSATEEAANYGESVTYDSNGNITRLVRHGKQIDQSFGVVDTLSISYSGNRIIGVEKGGEVMPTANSLGIRQGSHDFAYNAVGAITQDGTRGITDIEYDLNSNPIRIQFNNGSVTKDHLGNNREVIGMDGKIKQRTDYYPFGTPIQDLGFGLAIQPYAYNGKEFDTTHGLNTHDYGARQYNTALPRWDRIDPLCEKYYHVSPYAYCFNNPVNAIDPDGKVVIFINGFHFGWEGGKESYWSGVDCQIMNLFNDKSVLYRDGSFGGLLNLFMNPLRINILASNRYLIGHKQGIIDGQSILDNLKAGETIKIVTHSMGGMYGKGYIAGIQEYAKLNNFDLHEKIEIELDLAPFQPSQQHAIDGIKTIQISHKGDWLAGTKSIVNALKEVTNHKFSILLEAHSIKSFKIEDIESVINKFIPLSNENTENDTFK